MNASIKQTKQQMIRPKENCTYHCNTTPAINGSNNLQKGAAFQMGMRYGCMAQNKYYTNNLGVELTEEWGGFSSG